MPDTWKLILLILLIMFFIVAAVVYWSNQALNKSVRTNALSLLETDPKHGTDLIKEEDLIGLPSCVQKWLLRSGVVGQERINTIRLLQTGRMRLGPDKPWMPFRAEQYINVAQPGFVWLARVKAAPLVSIVGYDRYLNGQGHMQIKLWGLIPVAKTQPGFEINQSTMHRFIAEMIWYPSAALNDYIKWEEIDADSARAIMTWQGVSAEMVFHFNDQGDLVSNIASRYREDRGSFVLTDWGGIARGYKEFHGIRIQSKSDIIWKYPSGDFNWLQLEINDISFNSAKLY